MNRRALLLATAGATGIGIAGCLDSVRDEREPPAASDPENYLFTNEAELHQLRTRAQNGEEPWAGALEELKTRASDAVAADPVPYDTNADRGNAPAALELIRDAALGYYFIEDDRFAESAIDAIYHFLLNEGTSYEPTEPVIPHARIINSLVIPGVLFGASLVRDHAQWERYGGETQLREWCETYLETSRQYSVDEYGDEQTLYRYPQNRFEYRIVECLATTAYLSDDERFDETVTLWKDFHDAKVPFPDADGNLAVFPDGRRNDAHRDAGWEYARFGLDACVSCAELARHKGYDLYRWQDTPASDDITNEEYEGERAGPLIPRQFRWLNTIFTNPDSWEGDSETTPPAIEPTNRGVVAYEYGASAFHGSEFGDEIQDIRPCLRVQFQAIEDLY